MVRNQGVERDPHHYRRILLAGAAIGAYILAFLLLYPRVGRVVTAGTVIPMAALGLLWGARAGALGALCSIPLNTLLMRAAASSDWDVMLQPLALPGVIGAIIVGTVTGGLRDLRAETEQARIARYRADARLLESERRFRALIEKSSDGIGLVDAGGNIVYVSPSITTVQGYAPEEMIGKSAFDQVHPDDQPQSRARFAELLRGARTVTMEYRFRHGDGSWRWFKGVGTNMLDDPDVRAIVVNFRDISERKQAEAEVQRSHAELEGRVAERTAELNEAKTLLEHLVAASPGVVFRVDLHDFRPTYVSPNVERLYGYTQQEFLEHPTFWMGAVHPDDLEVVLARLKLVLERKADHVSVEARLQNKAGSYRWLDIYAVAEHDASGNPVAVLGYAVDISERKKAERNLHEARFEAEQANRAKSEFLSRMSHELRTPLNAILGFAQLLEMEPHTPEAAECIGYILRGGRHLLELINEVLDITRIEAGRLELSPEPVAVGEVVADSLSLIAPLAAQRNVQLNTELATPHEGYVLADRQRLRQILLNLLSNAVKYNRDGGLVAISVTETPRGRRRINIIDTGPGIPREKLDRLFTPFERLGQSAVEGTGIGLALSRRLARLMGGEVGVESQEGEGSTFWVELDSATHPTERLPWPATDQAGSPPAVEEPQRIRSLLYVEDNLSNLELVRRALATRSATALHTATSGRQGVVLAREHRPDLILLDLHLSDMSGVDVIHELRADPRTAWIPIVVLSADVSPDQRAALLASGAQAYLTKPLDLNRLFTLLDDSLMVGGPIGRG
jgi:PAS domain S-box-containing protein